MYLHTQQFAPLYPYIYIYIYIYIEKHIMYLFSLCIWIYSDLYIILRDNLGHVLFFCVLMAGRSKLFTFAWPASFKLKKPRKKHN